MQDSTSINGYILAGGQSRRMGQSKGLLQWEGHAFVTHILNALLPITDAQYLISSDARYDRFACPRLEDNIPDAGPLAGLQTALNHSHVPWNFILCCDAPRVSTGLLEKLSSVRKNTVDSIHFEHQGTSIPLIGLYHRRCLPVIEEALSKGELRLTSVLKNLRVKTISLDNHWAKQAVNINTPSDFKNLIA